MKRDTHRSHPSSSPLKEGSSGFMNIPPPTEYITELTSLLLPWIGDDLSSNDGFVDMPEISEQTPSQHGAYPGGGSPYPGGGHESGGGSSGGSSIHHFPHFTPDGIPVYPPIGKDSTYQLSWFREDNSFLSLGGSSSGGNPVVSTSPGAPHPLPHHPHSSHSYQEYPPSPASWMSDVDSNAANNNSQYWPGTSVSSLQAPTAHTGIRVKAHKGHNKKKTFMS